MDSKDIVGAIGSWLLISLSGLVGLWVGSLLFHHLPPSIRHPIGAQAIQSVAVALEVAGVLVFSGIGFYVGLLLSRQLGLLKRK